MYQFGGAQTNPWAQF